MNESFAYAPSGETVELDRDYGRDEIRSIDILENCQNIHPITPEYASAPLKEAFDWDHVYEKVAEEFPDIIAKNPELAVFAFYSQPNPNMSQSARHELDTADILSFLEARRKKPDDFLYYYRGEPDVNGNVMSFCVWTDFAAAQSVTKSKFHEDAAKLAKESYDEAHVQGHTMSRPEGSDGVVLKPEFERSLNVGVAKAA